VTVVAGTTDGVKVTVTMRCTEGVKVEVTVTMSLTADAVLGLAGTTIELKVIPRTENTWPPLHEPKSFWQFFGAQ
jgi:hypothetical protein